MASIGRITSAALSQSNELTVAAATLNFVFALFKCEAPKEFSGCGNALSLSRRADAEDGQAHVTARKLGALFESMVPQIPHLIKAYGTRVSEISVSAEIKCDRHANGIFAKHTGFDGTSIWAAATFG
ncbi:hypothetical protein GGR57DRAFT_110719 [Xylariaceae sp. FL1272]|nr:hypothetical protein GGR57DRAFT_110719 [Xylariaceae sp. FL1272]